MAADVCISYSSKIQWQVQKFWKEAEDNVLAP